MVLVLDPLVKDDESLLIQPVLSHCQLSEDSDTLQPSKSSLDTTQISEKIPASSTIRSRLDSGASNRSNSPFQQQQLGSSASEPGVDVSNLGRRNRSDSTTSNHSLSSEDKHPTQEAQEVQVSQVSVSRDTSGTDSETECHNNEQDQPDRGAFSQRGHHVNGLVNGSAKGKIDFLKEKVVHLSVCPSLLPYC